MDSYYLLLPNPPTHIPNFIEEQYPNIIENQTETTNDEKARILSECSGNKIWHSDMDKDLIRLIKEEECLWNITCESYKYKKNKWDALERVANEMKRLWPPYQDIFTLSKCCSKFRNLRTYYQRERKKQLNNKLRKRPHSVRWIHFDDMSFLNASDYKLQYPEKNNSPTSFQFSSDNRDTSHEANEESMDVSRMLDPGNSSSTEEDEDQPDEDENSCSEIEENSPKAKKKLFKHKVGTSSSNGFSKRSKTTNFKSSKLKGASPKPKNTEQHITHDEAFANFIAKDLEKIPEGKQKEQLRFKILELIHCCKMDANFMPR